MQTITETDRRLRIAGQLARRQLGVARNARVEIGHRVVPQNVSKAPTTREEANAASYAPEDDLEDFNSIEGAARTDYVRQGGAVVHLYVHSWDGYEHYLVDVVVAWLGVGDEEPRIIDTRFVRYPA